MDIIQTTWSLLFFCCWWWHYPANLKFSWILEFSHNTDFIPHVRGWNNPMAYLTVREGCCSYGISTSVCKEIMQTVQVHYKLANKKSCFETGLYNLSVKLMWQICSYMTKCKAVTQCSTYWTDILTPLYKMHVVSKVWLKIKHTLSSKINFLYS